MDSDLGWVISLEQAAASKERLVGGKAAKLAQLAGAGYRVPRGFCITTLAYEHFLKEGGLANVIRMETGRKPFASLRWEEIWDMALRIRSAFLAAPIPEAVSRAISTEVQALGANQAFAVRSSAPGEDSSDRSFAGLHESVVGVVGRKAVLDAVRVVWASLWSDAALLYRQELSLDPTLSQMAVIVQEMADERPSGVAFGRDPRDFQKDHAIVEAVPGPCGDLVDGLVDPDHWTLARSSGQVLEWRPGNRETDQAQGPILTADDLNGVLGTLLSVESLLGWPPDTEWTGRSERFTLLQARPITTVRPDPDDVREWYMSLRPGMQRLEGLAKRVAEELIPRLEREGDRLAAEALDDLSDRELAAAIEERLAIVREWRQIYLDEFIPFAHGVRQLGAYYNDAVRPEDPYEFVGLLKGEEMVASRRNQALENLAKRVRENRTLQDMIHQIVSGAAESQGRTSWGEARAQLRNLPRGHDFVREFERVLQGYMDVSFAGERLADRPDLLLETVLEMSESYDRRHQQELDPGLGEPNVRLLEQRLMDAVGEERKEQARQVLAIGRLSWRLRDDDNVLVGRLESQLLRALNLASDRLRTAGRLQNQPKVGIEASQVIAQSLQDPFEGPVILPTEPETEPPVQSTASGETLRQLVGQPAAPGLATGRVRCVQSTQDLGRFRAGEVLVCDAIQPTMTHLIPLACAIVERRGGMLIHGSIIARELGIPCVNGIPNAVDLLEDSELVTVDGFLGIVTVGPPEFDLEVSL